MVCQEYVDFVYLKKFAKCWWFMPIILAIQEAEIRRKPVQANSLRDPISKKPITKQGLVEWLKV
jgi:hypothetical protein